MSGKAGVYRHTENTQHLNICKPESPLIWILAIPYHIHTYRHKYYYAQRNSAENTVLIVSVLVLFMFGYYTIKISILRISLTALVFPTCASGHCLQNIDCHSQTREAEGCLGELEKKLSYKHCFVIRECNNSNTYTELRREWQRHLFIYL